MTLYNSRVIAQWIGVTDRRVRQLRDKGVLQEAKPGYYDLKSSVLRYINYLREGTEAVNLNEERAGLMKAKREAAEMKNALERKDLHRSEEIEAGLRTIFLNVRSRFLSLPSKLTPSLASMGGNRGKIYDALRDAIMEALDEMSDWRVALAEISGEGGGEDEEGSAE